MTTHDNLIYQNIHRHSYRTNIRIADSVVSNEAYAKRAVELGHGIIASTEHGWQGRYIECFEYAKQYGLKFVQACEAYWVKDRLIPDRTNCHILIAAKTEKGRRAMNDVLSEANISGFYGQARLDIPLILSLPPKDVIVQTACIAYWKYEDIDDITKRFRDHFEENFFLEVQPHVAEKQKIVNDHILELSVKEKIPLILGCDSHYIFPQNAQERSDYIASKGMAYPDEEGFILDYPSGEEVYNRFARQGVLGDSEIISAMDNTNIYLTVEDYECPCFNHDIKMPSLYEGLTQEQKDRIYDAEIWSAWEKEKACAPPELHKHYEEEIRKEVDIVHKTFHADYFLIDKEVVQEGLRRGGVLTSTGRGSAPSFYTNKLLGLTEIDRISAKVKMYPERFMSPTRILETKSLADIDLNVADRTPFLEAQKAVLGPEHSEEMIAYGTLKTKAAWKMYAKSQNVDFDVANEISDQIDKFENALKHASEDEKDDIDPLDYIDPDYHELFKQCREYLGITSHVTPHPCATLVYQGNIREEIGLISVKGEICCIMDGKWAEEYKFLKNDWLKVSVVGLIDRVYKRIGIPKHTVSELLELCPPESPVWDIYKKRCTMGINQVEQPGTSKRVSVYAPKNISELCAFIAAIRPGFKSMYKVFESRQHFDYGIPALDAILQTPEMPNSFVLYQELSMAVLNYAGIPMSECYDVIKNIAKKRVKKVLKYKEQFLKGFEEVLVTKDRLTPSAAEQTAQKIWQILDDSSQYSFNCVSGDTVIYRPAQTKAKFQSTVEQMYLIMNDKRYAVDTGHLSLHQKYRRNGYGEALSMFSDLTVRPNKIVDIWPSDERQTYLVTTATGKHIVCTANHKIPTPGGEKTLSELNIGSKVYCLGQYQKSQQKYSLTNGDYDKNIPLKGQKGFQPRPEAASVVYRAYRVRKKKELARCEKCGCQYSDNKRFEVHHKDNDRTNNCEENYMWVCASCHKKIHYKEGRVRRFEKGLPTYVDEIVSISPRRVEQTYNVEMADPAHTFISQDGLVVSNCSHSYSVAIDSLYGAYQKTFYPLEFYETLLRGYEKNGEKDKLNAAKEEAESYFSIAFPPYKFGQDNRNITASEETRTITKSISSIKGFGSDIGNILYDCGRQHFTSFFEVLSFLDGKSIKAAKVQPLINIDYFSDFGNIPTLTKLLSLWDFFKQGTAKKISKDKVSGNMEKLLSNFASDKNAKSESLKSYTITDMPGLLKAVEQAVLSLNIPDVDYKVKAANQLDVLGYVDLTTGKPEDRKKLLITGVCPIQSKDKNEIWGYRIGTKSLGSGKTASLTVRSYVYNKHQFVQGDILYADNVTKNKSGYWYLNEYHKVG